MSAKVQPEIDLNFNKLTRNIQPKSSYNLIAAHAHVDKAGFEHVRKIQADHVHIEPSKTLKYIQNNVNNGEKLLLMKMHHTKITLFVVCQYSNSNRYMQMYIFSPEIDLFVATTLLRGRQHL